MDKIKLSRLEPILKDKLKNLKNKKVLIIGLGGVGGYVLESIVRSGIDFIGICDGDKIELTNFNRQLLAVNSSLGKDKVEVAKERIISINEECKIEKYNFFIDEKTINQIDFSKYNLVIDCIDDVKAKILIIEKCKDENVELVSCMGTGNKTNINGFKIADINQTEYCPLAKKIRIELRKKGISKVKVCYSNEIPIKSEEFISSQVFVVASAAMCISKYAIDYLVSLE